MSTWTVELSRPAARVLAALYRADRVLYGRFLNALEEIRLHPEIGKPLQGVLKGLRSLRVGSHRIVYEVVRKRLVILVLDLGPRGSVYRDL